MILTFLVRNQTISYIDTKVTPRIGSSKYLQLKFNFATKDWSSLRKTLHISAGEYSEPFILESNIFDVPAYYTQQESFKITLLGDNESEGTVVPTNVLTVSLDKSNTLWTAQPPDPQNSAYIELLNFIGNLNDLTTEAKNNLVAAINEVAQTGSSSTSIAMRVKGGYIQYSTDNGKTWTNLIAESDLKGDKGADGKDGAPGKDGTSGADGVTPHIGDNGNWYLGTTDTGKPSRGAAGSAGQAGKDGKSAYQYAQEGGYTGTETEFAAKLAAEIPSVDSTLTQSGQAADAAAVGNRLSALSEEIAAIEDKTNVNSTGWTSAQIALLNQLFDYIPWTNAGAGAIADSLIASLTSASSPEDNITQSGGILTIIALKTEPNQTGNVLTVA